MSLDGKIAVENGSSRWITGEASRRHGHTLRNTYEAILVGIGTVRQDNPSLTCRLSGERCRNPLRIVVDSSLSIDEKSRVFDGDEADQVIIATTRKAPKTKARRLESRATILSVNEGGRVHLPSLLRELGERHITSVLVEGGGEINGSFLDADLVDRYYFCLAPRIVGGRNAVSAFSGKEMESLDSTAELSDVTVTRLGDGLLVSGHRMHPWRYS